jgi:peroxidase
LINILLKQSGGPNWELPLGRRDSKTASLRGSNKNIPPPNATIEGLLTFFKRQGLDEVDLVALSGGTFKFLITFSISVTY